MADLQGDVGFPTSAGILFGLGLGPVHPLALLSEEPHPLVWQAPTRRDADGLRHLQLG
jgi:hypothetical protein